MIMAKIQKPQTAKARKGTPPKLDEAPIRADRNLDKTPNQEIVNINFKVPSEFRKEFKQYALSEGLSGVELFRRCFEEYKK
jgi:hypothetical protein